MFILFCLFALFSGVLKNICVFPITIGYNILVSIQFRTVLWVTDFIFWVYLSLVLGLNCVSEPLSGHLLTNRSLSAVSTVWQVSHLSNWFQTQLVHMWRFVSAVTAEVCVVCSYVLTLVKTAHSRKEILLLWCLIVISGTGKPQKQTLANGNNPPIMFFSAACLPFSLHKFFYNE